MGKCPHIEMELCKVIPITRLLPEKKKKGVDELIEQNLFFTESPVFKALFQNIHILLKQAVRFHNYFGPLRKTDA